VLIHTVRVSATEEYGELAQKALKIIMQFPVTYLG
jgi:hypothetical protein